MDAYDWFTKNGFPQEIASVITGPEEIAEIAKQELAKANAAGITINRGLKGMYDTLIDYWADISED